MVPEPPERWTAILNPAAGRGHSRSTLPRVADALARAHLDAEIVLSADGGDLLRLAQDAFARDRGVIACGGDGTVCALAGVAAENGGVLALVPMGAGNDFARQLDIPRGDIVAAVRVIERGHVGLVDLGRAQASNGCTAWFTTVANTGFDAEANRWANHVTWMSGTPLYVAATLRSLAVYRPRKFRLAIDGEAMRVDAWLVAVGNTRTYAGGMMITPGANVHDGLLDVCVVGPVGRAEFLRTFPSVFKGEHVRHPLVQTCRAREVTIEAVDDATPAQRELWASGERVGPLPARIDAVADALAVVVPTRRRSGAVPGGRDGVAESTIPTS